LPVTDRSLVAAKDKVGLGVVELDTCPLCGSTELESLPVRNLNSRDPARVERMRERFGSEFFVQQRLSICARCNNVFQSSRPTPAALQMLYDSFAETVSKVTPRSENMFEYVFKDNPKDYVHMAAESLEFLDRLDLVDMTNSVLEIRTYGGGLLGLLRERGVSHCEGAYIQEFDREMARRIFEIEELVPFTFTRPIDEFIPARERYDLIVTYEGLTHSPDPVRFLRWIGDHLAERGSAVLFREPDTPAYRRYQPLEVVFNNFHMNLLNRRVAESLIKHAGGLRASLDEDYHPDYARPLYLNIVLTASGTDASAPISGPCYDAHFYRSWIAEDATPRRRALSNARRRLVRLTEPVYVGMRDEIAASLAARLARR